MLQKFGVVVGGWWWCKPSLVFIFRPFVELNKTVLCTVLKNTLYEIFDLEELAVIHLNDFISPLTSSTAHQMTPQMINYVEFVWNRLI